MKALADGKHAYLWSSPGRGAFSLLTSGLGLQGQTGPILPGGPLASSGPRRGGHSWASTGDEVIVENARISKLEYIMAYGFHQSRQLFTLHDSVFWRGEGGVGWREGWEDPL